MLALNVHSRIDPRLRSVLAEVGPAWRRQLFSVGATALSILLRRHLLREAHVRHKWSELLHAAPTHHISKGAARIFSRSTPTSATVTIPIAGISRAFHPLVITPVKAHCLTIPVAQASYGHTVRELRHNGWSIFRVKNHDILMGHPKGEKASQTLYALKKRVTIPQDRTLLPTDDEIASAINSAIITSIRSVHH